MSIGKQHFNEVVTTLRSALESHKDSPEAKAALYEVTLSLCSLYASQNSMFSQEKFLAAVDPTLAAMVESPTPRPDTLSQLELEAAKTAIAALKCGWRRMP